MPVYCYRCNLCGSTDELVRPMSNQPLWERKCLTCDKMSLKRHLQNELSKVAPFQPYEEDNFDGKKVEVTSPQHRDELCQKHGLTYDSVNISQRKAEVEDPLISEETIKNVIEETQGGKILPQDVQEACAKPTTDD